MTPPSGDPCRPLPASEFLTLFDGGTRVLDVRSGPEWAASHLKGSVFIGLSQMFPRWAQVLLDETQPWMVIADAGQEEGVIQCLQELGHQDIAGFLEGGYGSLGAHAERLVSTERVEHGGLAAELDSDNPPHLVDVRQPSEWQAGRIGEAPNVPLTEFEARRAEIPSDRRVIVQCLGGYRSLIAISLLEMHGIHGLVDMAGGFGAWAEHGRPVSPGV